MSVKERDAWGEAAEARPTTVRRACASCNRNLPPSALQPAAAEEERAREEAEEVGAVALYLTPPRRCLPLSPSLWSATPA
eukprot:2248413-Rhodomonas_salina.2